LLVAAIEHEELARLAEFIAQSVDAARSVEKPFYHLEFDRVFPDDIYAQVLNQMPQADATAAMPSRSAKTPGIRLTRSTIASSPAIRSC
jgi:hypothetical protein